MSTGLYYTPIKGRILFLHGKQQLHSEHVLVYESNFVTDIRRQLKKREFITFSSSTRSAPAAATEPVRNKLPFPDETVG